MWVVNLTKGGLPKPKKAPTEATEIGEENVISGGKRGGVGVRGRPGSIAGCELATVVLIRWLKAGRRHRWQPEVEAALG